MNLLEIISFFILISYSKSQNTDDCGAKYACLSYPNGCVNTGCTFIYKWKSNGNNLIDFVISGNIGSVSFNWLAIGFSNDQSMGNDSVALCAIPYNFVQHYVNNVYVTPSLMNPLNQSIGIFNSTVSSKNGWLTCSFTRMTSMRNQKNYFDLSNQYYILASFGIISSGSLQYHGTNRIFSATTFRFQSEPPFTNIPTMTSTLPSTNTKVTLVTSIQTQTTPLPKTTIFGSNLTQTPTVQGESFISTQKPTSVTKTLPNSISNLNQIKISDCGSTYRCFLYPSGCSDTGCTFIYKWKSNGNNLTDFLIAAKIGSITNNWVGIGFSNDLIMGGDDVVICQTNGLVQHYVNGYFVTPSLMNSNNPTVGLSISLVSSNNGWLTCSFTRQISMSSQKNYFDLNDLYYVFAAFGPLNSNGALVKHTTKVPSSTTYSFNTNIVINSQNKLQVPPIVSLWMIITSLLILAF